MKKRKLIVKAIGLLLLVSLCSWLLLTAKGAEFIIKTLSNKYDVQYKVEGSIYKGLVVKDITVEVPKYGLVRINKIEINSIPDAVKEIKLKSDIFNGRTNIFSEPILFNGTTENLTFQSEAYLKSLSSDDIFRVLPKLKVFKQIEGSLENIELTIEGDISNQKIKGSFEIEQAKYKQFKLIDIVAELDLEVKKKKLYGYITIEEGTLKSKKCDIELGRSKINFDANKVEFKFVGRTEIEDVEIKIQLVGNPKEYELILDSDSAISEELLLIMIVTGKRIDNWEEVFQGEKTSMRDKVISYFLDSQLDKLEELLGLSDLKVSLSEDSFGVGIKKKMSKRFKIGSEVSKTINGSSSSTKYRTMIQYKFTKDVFGEIGASHEENNGIINDGVDFRVKIRFW